MGTQIEKSKPKFNCEFCKKDFSRENTLLVHLCEPKRRYVQRNEKGVVVAMRAYSRFYELQQGSSVHRTYDDFSKSQYYSAFVKFGNHIQTIRAINPSSFIDYVIKNSKKLDHWCKDSMYQEYLETYIRNETSRDALERAIQEMERWAEDNNSEWNVFFKTVTKCFPMGRKAIRNIY